MLYKRDFLKRNKYNILKYNHNGRNARILCGSVGQRNTNNEVFKMKYLYIYIVRVDIFLLYYNILYKYLNCSQSRMYFITTMKI